MHLMSMQILRGRDATAGFSRLAGEGERRRWRRTRRRRPGGSQTTIRFRPLTRLQRTIVLSGASRMICVCRRERVNHSFIEIHDQGAARLCSRGARSNRDRHSLQHIRRHRGPAAAGSPTAAAAVAWAKSARSTRPERAISTAVDPRDGLAASAGVASGEIGRRSPRVKSWGMFRGNGPITRQFVTGVIVARTRSRRERRGLRAGWNCAAATSSGASLVLDGEECRQSELAEARVVVIERGQVNGDRSGIAQAAEGLDGRRRSPASRAARRARATRGTAACN